jgi:polysaccharide biosynthesis protein PslF
MFLKNCAPDGVLLIFLGEMYDDHPMMTFAPAIAKAACPSATFVTQFEHLGARVWDMPGWTRLGRKYMAGWLSGPEIDYTYGVLLRDSNRVIVLSESHKVALANHFSKLDQKCVLIPPPPTIKLLPDNGGETRSRGRASLGVKDGDFLIVYYGYVYPSKGVETLLQAFKNIVRCKSTARLAIIGGVLEHLWGDSSPKSNRYVEELQSLPVRLGIADRIIWTGACAPEGDDGSLYLRAADACVLPFDKGVYLNNSSFAVAAAHGLPIITTMGSMVETPLVHGSNVILCPPKDPTMLTGAIELLIHNGDMRRRLQNGARTLAREWFSWDRATDRLIESFNTN